MGSTLYVNQNLSCSGLIFKLHLVLLCYNRGQFYKLANGDLPEVYFFRSNEAMMTPSAMFDSVNAEFEAKGMIGAIVEVSEEDYEANSPKTMPSLDLEGIFDKSTPEEKLALANLVKELHAAMKKSEK